MFEHRLGLALHLTLGGVRALPAPEYRRWQLFYLIEPWGWQDAEYRTAAVLSRLYNVNSGKGKQREVKDDMRDMTGEILKRLEGSPIPDDMPFEQKRELILAAIKRDWEGVILLPPQP